MLHGDVKLLESDHASAAWDTTPVGRAAMRSLVGLKSSASLLDVYHSQASKLASIVDVAKIRALQAQREVDLLRQLSKKDPHALLGQIGEGPGFGNRDAQTGTDGNADVLSGTSEIASVFGGSGRKGKGKKPKRQGKRGSRNSRSRGGASSIAGGLMEREGDSDYDADGYNVTESLKALADITRQVSRDSQPLLRDAANANRSASSALQTAKRFLQFPGEPVELAVGFGGRGASLRPRELAPAWMDFVYASSTGSDPYRVPDLGEKRLISSADSAVRATQNPFLS
eukprot:TRINITY_DN63600_c0_g1_i1.p1 TRINITY_DN63600_c0_g1~~TRINITY_DN63600_c0_g1_i1.p1  ORF type:complete len:285 (+),score=35.33 TRINITY_DN63600_c0_g1_i1:178-1032(+)